MKKLITIVLILFSTQGFAQLTKDELYHYIDSIVKTNNNKEITAAKLNALLKAMVGNGTALQKYKNEAMTDSVEVYLWKTSDDSVRMIYEPSRNNAVKLKSVTDKFQFDNTGWVNNSVSEVDFVDVDATAIISGNTMENMVFKGGGNTGLIYRGNNQKGILGARCPHGAEVHVVGDNVTIDGNTFSSGSDADGDNPVYLDSLGDNCQIFINKIEQSGIILCNGHSDVSILYNSLSTYTTIEIEDDMAGFSIYDNELDNASTLKISTAKNAIYNNLGVRAIVTLNGGAAQRCTFGNYSVPIIIGDCSYSEFNNIQFGGKVGPVEYSVLDNYLCTSDSLVSITNCQLTKVKIENPGEGWMFSDSRVFNTVLKGSGDTVYNFTYKNNEQTGMYGQFAPNGAEVYISGYNVLMAGNKFDVQAQYTGTSFISSFIDDIGNGSKFMGNSLTATEINFHGNTLQVDANDFGNFSILDINISVDPGVGGFSQNTVASNAYVNLALGSEGGADNNYFGAGSTAFISGTNDVTKQFKQNRIGVKATFGNGSDISYLNKSEIGSNSTVVPSANVAIKTSTIANNVSYNPAVNLTSIFYQPLPNYADNAAAVSAGLPVGALYQTSGVVKIVTP